MAVYACRLSYGTAIPLLQRCAALGFLDVGVPYLNVLLKAMPPNTLKKQPVTVVEKVFARILWLVPDFKNWQVICQNRKNAHGGKPLVGESGSLAEEVMDNSDKVELRKEHHKHEDGELLT